MFYQLFYYNFSIIPFQTDEPNQKLHIRTLVTVSHVPEYYQRSVFEVVTAKAPLLSEFSTSSFVRISPPAITGIPVVS